MNGASECGRALAVWQSACPRRFLALSSPGPQHTDACRWTLLPRSGAPNGLIHIRCCRSWFYRAEGGWLFSQNHEIRYGLLY